MTDTAKHTPGPWKATDSGVTAVTVADANVVCEAPIHYLKSRENWPANARLIAAAPELLALAETVVSEACRIGAGVHPEHPLRPLLETARAAIAKTIGEQS